MGIFKYLQKEQYPDLIILDEAGMVNIFLYSKLIKQCNKFGCGLILLGDVKQLPPIGLGKPFDDIIRSSDIIHNVLTDIKRQQAGSLCNFIKNISAKKPDFSVKGFDNNNTVFIEQSFANEKDIRRLLQTTYKQYARDVKLSDIACISPQNKYNGGVERMNLMLQNLLNNNVPHYIGPYKKIIKDNDRIVRTVNHYGKTENDTYVNGATGVISFNEYNEITIHYDDNRTEIVKSDEYFIQNFELGYCSTVHKWQGGQAKVVILIVSEYHTMFTFQQALQLAYTAITRATQKLIVIGKKSIFENIQNLPEKKFVSGFMKHFNDN